MTLDRETDQGPSRAQMQDEARAGIAEKGAAFAAQQEAARKAAHDKLTEASGLSALEQEALLREPKPEPFPHEQPPEIIGRITDLGLIEQAITAAELAGDQEYATAWKMRMIAVNEQAAATTYDEESLALGEAVAESFRESVAQKDNPHQGIAGAEVVAPGDTALANALADAGVSSREELAAKTEEAQRNADEAARNHWYDAETQRRRAIELGEKLAAVDAAAEQVANPEATVVDRASAMDSIDAKLDQFTQDHYNR